MAVVLAILGVSALLVSLAAVLFHEIPALLLTHLDSLTVLLALIFYRMRFTMLILKLCLLFFELGIICTGITSLI
jgi:hypothetical protein